MLEKMNQINLLYDAYHVLLTEKQRQYMELYYQEDLSLGEIADEFKVSRNAVHDNIKRTEKLLLDYENKLHLHKKSRLREDIYQQIKEQTTDKQIVDQIEQLQQLDEEEI